MALFTGKGDLGTTKTLKQGKGERISKSSCLTEALGTVDELNSFLGLCKVRAKKFRWKVSDLSFQQIVNQAQQDLFIVQAELAGAKKTIKASKLGEIEDLVAEMERQMPPIKTFFVSGGTEEAALFDFARTLARRAEREVIRAVGVGEAEIGDNTRAYLNRLSTLFYAMARLINHLSGIKEEPPTYE